MSFKQPPILYNDKGEIRTVGFELEYANLTIEQSVNIIQKLYGGEIKQENRFFQKVLNTRIGDFAVEFDLTLLTEKGYKKVFDKFNLDLESVKLGEGTLAEEIETVLEGVLGKIFPYEIATPPIPCTQLEQLESLRRELYKHKAEGTESFLTNAFGTHINIEVPACNCDTFLNYLKAFVLLYPWLLEIGETDFARKVSPFINPYPAAYTELILSKDYHPDLKSFIKDYNTHNPDRNRPVDMYPLFAALEKDLVAGFSGLGKVKPRKTFHYRLPNSSVSKPDWSLALEWNNWVKVEELANNAEQLNQLCREYLEMKNYMLVGFDRRWIKKIDDEFNDNRI